MGGVFDNSPEPGTEPSLHGASSCSCPLTLLSGPRDPHFTDEGMKAQSLGHLPQQAQGRNSAPAGLSPQSPLSWELQAQISRPVPGHRGREKENFRDEVCSMTPGPQARRGPWAGGGGRTWWSRWGHPAQSPAHCMPGEGPSLPQSFSCTRQGCVLLE